jgi:hypothetical protein
MSKLPTAQELKEIKKVVQEVKERALFKSAALESRNKEAAKQHLLAIQLLISRKIVR